MNYTNYQHLVDWVMLSSYEFYKKYPNFSSEAVAGVLDAVQYLEKQGAVHNFVQVVWTFINCEPSEAIQRTVWLNQFCIEQVIGYDANQLETRFNDGYELTEPVITLDGRQATGNLTIK